MPGRSFSAASQYRYGFNGQEKSTEINGSSNLYTAEFWQYDSRLGRRWNVDPVYKHSPYETFANSPLLFTDRSGSDTLSYNTSGGSEQDLRSIVKSENEKYLKFDQKGLVTMSQEFLSLSSENQKGLLEADIGLNLLNSEINSSSNFYYASSASMRYFRTDVNGNIAKNGDGEDFLISGNLYDNFKSGEILEGKKDDNGDVPLYMSFTNLSNTARGDETELGFGQKPSRQVNIGNINGIYTRKYDGEVTIAPGQFYGQSHAGGTISIPRSSIIFHELKENFLRVSGLSYAEAHEKATNAAYSNPRVLGAGFTPGNNLSSFKLK